MSSTFVRRNISLLVSLGLAAVMLVLVLGGGVFAEGASTSAVEFSTLVPEESAATGVYQQTFKLNNSLLPPAITAVKSVVLQDDADTSSGATPGDTLRYTVGITNAGTDDALGVVFTDTIDIHTTLSGVAHVSPIAFDDSFTSLGNVGITVPAISGVLANDVDPDNNSGTLTVVAAAGATTQGGAFAIAADGGFSYTPPAGYEGSDSFTYSLNDGDPITPNGTGVVNITVNEVIWFVNTSAGVQGTGLLSNPYNSLDGAGGYNATASDDPNDIIFLYSSATAYSGGITLQNGQSVIGQGASASIAAITGIAVPPFSNPLPATGGARPSLTNTAGNGVLLAQNNTARGFNIGNTTGGDGLQNNGGTVGTLSVSEMAISGTGGGVDINNGGTLNVTLDSVASSGAPVSGIRLTGVGGGFTVSGNLSIATPGGAGVQIGTSSATVNFQGGTKTVNTGAQTAVNLTSNTGTINFTNGGLDIDTTTGIGFNATGGGTITVQGTGNTINSTSQQALNVSGNTIIGAAGLTFQQISSSGGTNGILLAQTGAGGLTVTGNGGTCTSSATCTGGTIQNTTSDGIVLQNVNNISFNHVLIDNTGRHGVHVPDATANTGVNNFTFMNGRLEDIGNANDEMGMNFGWDAAFVGGLGFVPALPKLSGTANISNTLFLRIAKHNIEVENGDGNLNLTVENSTFQNNFNNLCGGSNCEGSAILIRADGDGNGGSPVITLNVLSTTFNNIDLDGIDVGADPGGTVYFIADGISGVNNSQMDNLVDVAADGGPTGDFEMRLTDFTSDGNHRGTVIFIKVDGTSTMDGLIGVVNQANNTIGGSQIGRGIDIFVDGDLQVEDPSVRLTIQNTIISNTEFEGLYAQLSDGDTDAANLHLTVANVNVTTAPGFGFVEGMGFYNGILAGDDGVMCLDIDGSSSTSPAFFDDIRLRHRYSTIFHVEGYAGGPMDTAAIEAYIAGNNVGISTVDVAISDGAPGITGTACNDPVLTNVFTDEQKQQGAEEVPADVLMSKLAISQAAVSESVAVEAVAQPEASLAERPSSQAKPNAVPSAVPAFSGETINLSIGTLPVGKSVFVIFDATIDSPLSPADLVPQVCNTAIIQGSNFADVTTNQACTTLQTGAIVIVKDAIPDGPTDFGFTATGLVPATFDLDDDADPTLSNTALYVNVSPGQYTVAENDPSGTGYLLANLVCDDDASSVASTENVGTRTATINLEPNESVTCTFTNISGPELMINKDDGGITVQPGGTIAYTLNYTNGLGSNASGVVLTDTVPADTTFNAGASTAGWVCVPDANAGSTCTFAVGSLAGGATGSATFAVDVDNPVPGGVVQIDNTAEIGDDGANGPDQNPGNNVDTETTPIDAPPTITNISISPVAINENQSAVLDVTIEDIGVQESHVVDIDWGDGMVGTVNLVTGTLSFTASHQYLDDNPSGTPTDNYTINIVVTEPDNDSVSGNTAVTVNNVAPSINNGVVSTPINENDMATLSGDIVDPGTQDTFQLVVDWGDGTTMTYTYGAGTTSFNEVHQYLDDDPSGTAVDIYQVALTLTDDDTGAGATTLPLTINNLPPTLSNLAATPLVISETNMITLTGVISDIGSQDTFSLTVDWKDGNVETFSYPAGTSNFLETHTYLDDGFVESLLADFVIDATVLDDDTGSSPTMSVTVMVNNVAPTLSNVDATSVLENGFSTLTAVISEVSPLDTFSLTVAWGDGAVVTYSYPAGTTAVSETHQYLDDDPTGTPADVYSLTLTLVDDNGGTAIAATSITVTNVAPSVSATAVPMAVNIGAPVDFTGVFSDVGTLDTHTIVWDFGDGVTTTGTLTPTHVYTVMGVYDAVLTVTDDDGGVGTATVQVTVEMPTDVGLSSFDGSRSRSGIRTTVIGVLFLLGMAGVMIRRQRLIIRNK